MARTRAHARAYTGGPRTSSGDGLGGRLAARILCAFLNDSRQQRSARGRMRRFRTPPLRRCRRQRRLSPRAVLRAPRRSAHACNGPSTGVCRGLATKPLRCHPPLPHRLTCRSQQSGRSHDSPAQCPRQRRQRTLVGTGGRFCPCLGVNRALESRAAAEAKRADWALRHQHLQGRPPPRRPPLLPHHCPRHPGAYRCRPPPFTALGGGSHDRSDVRDNVVAVHHPRRHSGCC